MTIRRARLSSLAKINLDLRVLYRREDGWLGLERTFRFDYSHDGLERHGGRLVLRGERLVSFVGPSSGAHVIPFDRARRD